jgi:cytoskeletal protein RodZ
MTTHDQARRIARDVPADARAPEQVRPMLPERLFSARERKGVDLYRAERDTKIRARYLAALERGDYRELPGLVYTRGFLRNYALYLGLDPDDVIRQWHRERGDATLAPPAISVPRPLTTPRQGLTFSRGVLAAVLLTLAVVAFGAYLGVQLLRFARPPAIAVTDPPTAVFELSDSESQYTLRGTTSPGATVEIKAAGLEEPYRTTADSTGAWSYTVDVRRGRNTFEVQAKDPDTLKTSDHSVSIVINVPFLAVQAPTLTVDQPADGATYENGAIPVEGTTSNAKTVTVSAAWTGPVGVAGGTVPTASPSGSPRPTPRPTARPTTSPGASSRPAASPSPAGPAAPSPQSVAPDTDGSYSVPLELTAGRWAITVTAASSDGKTVAITRNVSVNYKGVNLVVSIQGGSAWIKAWVDGQVSDVTGPAGRTYTDGHVLTLSGTTSVEVRTGKSSVTYFTLNGTSLGRLSSDPNPGTWLFQPPNPPQRTNRT